MIEYEWDIEKALSNKSKHGVDFTIVRSADWDYALEHYDSDSFSEERWRAIIPIKDELFVLVYTDRDTHIRVISLRHATNAEKTIWKEFYG